MLVGLLTIEQKEELVGIEYEPFSYFNPVQDGNGDWIISTVEMDDNINPDVMWVKDLPLIEWNPPVVEPLYIL
jgi:hypothetical protein